MPAAALLIVLAVVVCLCCFASPANAQATRPATAPSSVLEFTVDDITGKPVRLADYKGRVLLIVNTASKCGHTPQYATMEALYRKYKDKGLAILAFPANEFGGQEPGTNEQIKEFCSSKFDVSFDLFAKVVVRGEKQVPLYQFLTDAATNPKFAGPIKWNFTKFLVGRDGQVVARFEPKTKPDDAEVIKAIEAELAK